MNGNGHITGPYLDVEDPAGLPIWTRHVPKWTDYPFLPSSVSCSDPVRYTDNIPDDLTSVFPYTRADFWNLVSWLGPPITWGKGYGFGIEVLHDLPPYLHDCTLVRDFVTHWPTSMSSLPDQSVLGTCDTLIPVVCAYCWAQSWLRCDSIPRVGAHGNVEARMSPVLEICAECGLTSDYNIARYVVLNRFDSVHSLLARGTASVRDIFRVVLGVTQWATPDDGFGFKNFVSKEATATFRRMMAMVRESLQAALDTCATSLARASNITGIIMMYWQGIDMTTKDLREPTSVNNAFLSDAIYCSHAFPCLPGQKCTWAEWTYEWAREVYDSHLNLSYKLRDHADTWFPGVNNWRPNSWAEWDVIRSHQCDMADDTSAGEGDEGDEGPETAIEELMDRERDRGFVVDYTDEEKDANEEPNGGFDVTDVSQRSAEVLADDREGNDAEVGMAESLPAIVHEDFDAGADDHITAPTEEEEDEYEARLYRDGWE